LPLSAGIGDPWLGTVPVVASQRILIVGGGYVGLYTALHLQRKLPAGQARITLVDPQSHMTYQPFLPEAAAGNLEPRHVVVSLRRELSRCEVLCGEIESVRHSERRATFVPEVGPSRELAYDVLVMAPGSVVRTLPIPGLAEAGIGFKSLAEAIYLRNRVLSSLDAADAIDDEAERRRLLTYVFIGGGYAGVEAMAELEDMARYAMERYYPGLIRTGLHFVLVEAAGRILPEVSPNLARYTTEALSARGIEVRCATRLISAEGGMIRLDDGARFPAGTLVWTAGVRANPLTARTDLPVDSAGRVRCLPTLAVEGVADAWSAGDVAAVPDLTRPGQMCAPSAQHAVRQAKCLAANLAGSFAGQPPVSYRHAYAGSVASLGLHKGVAELYGRQLRGWPAWLVHRTYHMSRMPTANRKIRVVADWTLALFFRREVVSLGSFADPRREFERASAGGDAQHGGG
jgi:NADH dehydrogenase